MNPKHSPGSTTTSPTLATMSHAMRRSSIRLVLATCCLILASCAAPPPNANGKATTNFNPQIAGPIQGVGIESQDIVSMSDQMMRDLLSAQRVAQSSQSKAARVIVDAEYFSNDSTQPINRNLITDRLRVSLNRAAMGRMTFVGRQYIKAVEAERSLKRSGTTDIGTTGLMRATLGADYRLGGRIASLDQKSAKTGMIQRYTQITFELIDLESSEIVWSGIYEFARAAADDVMYR